MKNKVILVSFIAIFAMIFTLNSVMASDIVNANPKVWVNDILISDNATAAGQVSDTVPVEVEFIAADNASDVRVKVYIEGYKDEISDSTARFHIVDGSTYIKRFSLKLPSSMDLDDLTEDLHLRVRIYSKGEENPFDESYDIVMQKDLYGLNFLSIEAPQEIIAGSSIALDVVLENNGNDELENVYVKASIPELGVERKVYFGDLSPQDECEDDDCDRDDTINKRIYLNIPRNSIPGIYNIKTEAYNYDTSVTADKKVIISGAQTGILPSVTSKAISTGEETTFDVVLINPNDRMVVYSITPEESKGLIIEIDNPIVTVSADSSKTVQVKVRATKSAEEGTHLVTVNVNSESGLVKQVNFSANVENANAKSNSVLILTVILAIIFIVLLIVLIVLLTKKSEEIEEPGEETSYY